MTTQGHTISQQEGTLLTRRRLERGQNSIDECKVFRMKDGRHCLRWKVRLWTGELKDCTTKGNYSKTEIKERARARAEQLLRSSGHADWSVSSSMADYVCTVAIPAVEQSSKLRANSKASYTRMLRYYTEAVGNAAIGDAVQPSSVDACIKAIALDRSYDIACQVRKVASKWVMGELVRTGVIAYNPLRQFTVDIPTTKKRKKQKVVPTSDERSALVSWLASLTVSDLPARGHSKSEDKLEVVDLTLVQATAGFRLSELLTLTGEDVTTHGQSVTIHVRPERSKTHKGRDCLLLNDDAAERVRGRVRRLSEPSGLVFPSPGTGCTPWDRTGAARASKRLYRLASEQLGIESLKHCTSHVWRTVLNDEWRAAGVPTHERAAYLGHGEDINASNYTEHQTLSTLYGLAHH